MTLSSAWRRPSTTASRARVERVGQIGRFLDALGIGALHARDLVVGRRRIEIGEQAAVVLAGDGVLEHRERGAAHGAVAAVVEHDGQDRQFVLGGDPVADGRIAEHVGAVAERGDDEGLSGAASLAPSAAPKPQPSPPAGPSAKKRARLLARAMVGPQRIFVEDDGVLADRLADGAREIFRRDGSARGRNPWRAARAACACARSGGRGGRRCAPPPFAGATRPPCRAPPAHG